MCSAVILGLKETEERYYMLVKDSKRYNEASMNCRWRGGNLVMPKTSHTNQLMADYISQAGLTRVYIGVEAQNKDSVSGATLTHTFLHTQALSAGLSCKFVKQIPPKQLVNLLFLSLGRWEQLRLCRLHPPGDLSCLES